MINSDKDRNMKFNSYQDIVKYFKTGTRSDYYETLIENKSILLQHLNIIPQGRMAADIGVTQPQMTPIVRLLRALERLEYNAANKA